MAKPKNWFFVYLLLFAGFSSFADNNRKAIVHPIRIKAGISSVKTAKRPLPHFNFGPPDIIINQCGSAPITLPTAADPYFNDPATIAAFPNGPTWSDGSTGNTFNVTASGTYWWQRTGPNLVVNGDFSSGDTGFTSAYVDKTTGSPNGTQLFAESTYAVGTNPKSYHSSFDQFGDHTNGTGKMLIVNGATVAGVNVWAGSAITVTPNTTYVFSAWATSATPTNPAQLQFSINGGTVGTINLSGASADGTWQYFSTTWSSGSNTTATISLVNNNTIANGNDFALDDIVFAKVFRQQYDVTMNPIPVLSATAVVCGVTSYDLTQTIVGYDPATYTYTFKDSGGTTLTPAQYTSAPDGIYSIVETNNVTGCSSSSQNVTVTISATPPLSVNSPVAGCGTYDLKSAINGYDGVTYTYTYKNGAATLGSSVVSTSGTYTIIATSNSTGCVSNSQNVVVTINPVPTFTATSPTLTCGTASYDLSTAISGAGGSYTYTYKDSGGNTLGSPTVTTSGTYSITATVGVTGCTTTKTVTVTVKPTPVVTVLPTVCITPGNTYDLRNAVIGYDPVNYTYLFKKGATTLNPTGGTNNYTTVGTGTNYTVRATSAAGCNSTTQTIIVQNGAPPTFTATSPTLACGTTSYDLSTAISNPGAANYTYQYLDSGGNTVASPTNITTSGTYYIIVTTAGGCESVSQAITVTLKPAPTFTVTNTTLACGVASYDLSTAVSGAGGSYTYTYQDSGGNPISSTVTVSGTYSIIATDAATACSITKTVNVTFATPPTLNVTSAATVCSALTYDLKNAITNYDSGAVYTYSGTGASGSTVSTVTVSATGSYIYTVTETKNGCSSTANVTLNFVTPPTLNVTSPQTACSSFDLHSAIVSPDPSVTYTYSSGSGTVTSSGTYTITATKNGCSTNVPVTVTINQPPALSVNSPQTACGSFDLHSAINSPDASVTYTYSGGSNNVTTSGTYTITATKNGCFATADVTVTINPVPVLAVTNPPAQCGGTYDLKNAITGYDAATYTYIYKNGAATLGSSMVSASGTYTLTETNIATGCQSAPQNVTVTINPVPILAVTNPPAQCGGTYDLKNAITGYDTATYTYVYKNGAATLGSSVVSASGTYNLTETNIATGCQSAPQNVTVTINPIPVLTLTNATACVTYDLTQTITGYDPATYTYVYKDSLGNIITPANAQAITASGTYTIIEQNIATGCQSLPKTTTVTITPNPVKPGITSL